MEANTMTVRTCFVLIAVTFFLFPAHAEPLLTGWFHNPANDHYYALLDFLPWHEAEAAAVSLGGHLVAINDAEENQWIMETFGSVDPRDYSDASYIPYELFLIGATDEAQEGVWTWTTGEPFVYTNWYPGEPNAYEGHDYGNIVIVR